MHQFIDGKISILFLTVLFSLFCQAVFASPLITVAKVRMVIGEEVYEWTDRASVPEKRSGTYTAPATIASFLDFAPEDRMTAEDLESRVKAARERLMRTGFFYAVEAGIVPPLAKPETRTVVIFVKEGFLLRFGGGPYYGSFGMVNVNGARESWEVFLGYNRDGVLLTHDAVNESAFFYSLEAFYENQLISDFITMHEGRIGLSGGLRPHPDVKISLGLAGHYRFVDESSPALTRYAASSTGFALAPFILFEVEQFTRLDPLEIVFKLRQAGGMGIYQSVTVFNADGRCSIVGSYGSLSLALQASCGAAVSADGSLPPLWEQFDLSLTPDRAVRSGYDYEELLVPQFLLGNAELRLRLFTLKAPPVFDIDFSIFAFADVARAAAYDSSDIRTLSAFGGGLRIEFKNPVFAGFTFAVGTNPVGKTRFIFTGTAGF